MTAGRNRSATWHHSWSICRCVHITMINQSRDVITSLLIEQHFDCMWTFYPVCRNIITSEYVSQMLWSRSAGWSWDLSGLSGDLVDQRCSQQLPQHKIDFLLGSARLGSARLGPAAHFATRRRWIVLLSPHLIFSCSRWHVGPVWHDRWPDMWCFIGKKFFTIGLIVYI